MFDGELFQTVKTQFNRVGFGMKPLIPDRSKHGTIAFSLEDPEMDEESACDSCGMFLGSLLDGLLRQSSAELGKVVPTS